MADEVVMDETVQPEIPAERPDDRKLLIKQRDEEKKARRALEAQLREAADKLAAIESEKAAEAEALERKKNDFAAIEQRRMKQIEAIEKRAADAEAKLAERDRADREAAFVDAVASKLGATNKLLVEGALHALKKRGLEIAPESVDETAAADAAKKVREMMPELVPARSGGSPGTPGVNLSIKPPNEKPDADPRKAGVLAAAAKYSAMHKGT